MSLPPDIRRLRSLTGIKWQRYGDDVLPAWVADMDFETAPAIVDALRAMVEHGDLGYNNVSFDDSLALAWADRSQRRFGWRPEPGLVRAFSNVLQPIAAALSLATAPGDGVLMFTPVYPPFWRIVEGSGRRIVEYRLDAREWRIDESVLRALVDSGTRAILLCNPHNPSGRVFDRPELEAIAAVARDSDLLVISDEIWQDLVFPGARHIPFASLGPHAAERTVTATAASKSFSLGGMGCAVAHLGHPAVADGIAAMTPSLLGGVNALGARATLAAWADGEDWFDKMMTTLLANRDHLLARLSAEAPEVGVLTPQATYLAWLDFRDTPLADDPAGRLLRDAGVALSVGPDFGAAGSGFARLNFATHPGILDEIVDRIVACLEASRTTTA